MRRYRGADNDTEIQFKDGGVYRYSAKRPGAELVAEMRRLAIAGKGLSTFINQHVREYECRVR
jgi:hypothetical protein